MGQRGWPEKFCLILRVPLPKMCCNGGRSIVCIINKLDQSALYRKCIVTQKVLRFKLASLFTLLITTSASISNAAGLDPTLTDSVVVRRPSNISESCITGSQKGIEIDARSWRYSGEEGVKHQRNGYQFWFENTSAGITHWYEYDDCRIISIFLAHPIADNPPAP
jgi:hypothetical protein